VIVRPKFQRLLFLTLLLGVVLSTSVTAQQSFTQGNRPLIGPQVGVGTNSFDLFIGGQFAYPVASQFDVYPSVQVYFPGNGISAWGFNAAARWWPKLTVANSGLYVGGGLNYTRASAGGFGFVASHSSAGLVLLGGWDFKAAKVRPFAELRAIIAGDYDRLDFTGGINFKL
jgi:hypothetical protein